MVIAQRVAISDLRGRLGPDRGDFPCLRFRSFLPPVCRGFLNGTTFDFVTFGPPLSASSYLRLGFICVYGQGDL